MGEFLLQHPWVQLYLIYVAVSLVACTWISLRESAAIQSDHGARPKEEAQGTTHHCPPI